MTELRRIVRVVVNPDGADTGSNGFAGRPAMSGLGRFYEIEVACRGEPDPVGGYLIDIKTIDRAVRSELAPAIARACADGETDAARVLSARLAALDEAVGGLLASVRWSLTPSLAVEIAMSESTRATISQRFDFAAAHRLHVPSLSDDENRRLFGKCNNPNGHGHNYRLDVSISVPLGAAAPAVRISALEEVVDQAVVARFDHTHLNEDTPEFAAGTGLNPSVENIARVCHGLLADAIARLGAGVRLERVTVWETDRTCASYPG